jgi:starch synthase
MKVLYASFECTPFVKVGGLADVVGSLPKVLKDMSVDVRIVIPLHKKIDREKFKLKNLGLKVLIPVGNEYIEGSIWTTKNDNVQVYFIENTRFFDRTEVYATEEGDYQDNPLRFIFFSRAVLETAKAVDFQPDIIHCHDMQTGLIPAYLKTLYKIDAFFQNTKTVFTIHNIAYQGVYGAEMHFVAGFPLFDFVPEKLEYYGKINFMKAGIVYADIVTTVSPTYAKMISSLHSEGRGLEGVLSKRASEGKLFGILNGIDYSEWNPETDVFIKANFNEKNIETKKLCKEDLQQVCSFEQKDVPLYGMVSRLDPLKGVDLIARVLPQFLSEQDVQVVILGKGYKNLQQQLEKIQQQFPKKFRLFLEFNNPLAHKIYAGSDFFLMPSNSEPCGLGQMMAMSYATAPIVFKTGGLADTVEQFDVRTLTGNGFVFEKYTAEDFYKSLLDTIKVYKDPNLLIQLRKNMFKYNFSWSSSANKYVELYSQLSGVHQTKIKKTKDEKKVRKKKK